jgi:hypothetical protein
MTSAQDIRIELEKAMAGMPYIFRTDEIRKRLDGNSDKVMANFDSSRLGPKGAFFIGRKIAYPKTEYIEWVCSRIRLKKDATHGKG